MSLTVFLAVIAAAFLHALWNALLRLGGSKIGAMVMLGQADTTLEKVIGFVAVFLGAGNAAGGYVVTERMLEMFKPSSKATDKKAGR